MDSILSPDMVYPTSHSFSRPALSITVSVFVSRCETRTYYKKRTKNPYHRRKQSKLPRDPQVNLFLKKRDTNPCPSKMDLVNNGKPFMTGRNLDVYEDVEEGDRVGEEGNVWETDEIETISSLFQGRIPQKPGKLNKVRPLPLHLPHKLRPVGLPTPKRHAKVASLSAINTWASLSKQVNKNPDFLVGLARDIRDLPKDRDVSVCLNKLAPFLRKGSLSLTIRELGHMGLPERALQTFCWAQKQPQLFPDDQVLASTVEVLARSNDLKVPFDLENITTFTSRSVFEAMMRGFIRGGNLSFAWKLLMVVKNREEIIDSSIYAKLLLEIGKSPDKEDLALALLNELGERDDLKLRQQDCTAVMKVCVRLRKYDIVESLFNWYIQSGHSPSVVMYTTMIHSRYSANKCREALALVWEMESTNCLFDLPAYRVVIKLFVALNDLSRTVRYFSRLKEAGFAPTYDIYQGVIRIYSASGRLAKCKEVCREAEMAGFKVDKQTQSELLQLQS